MTEINSGATRGKFFYGWWIVLVCMLCISTGPGPFAFASFGLFVLPMTQEFGWNRAEISFSLTVMIAVTAFSLPFVGRYVDRVGSRRILLLSMLALAACLAAIPAFVSELWHFTLIYFLIGTLAAGTNSVPYMPVLSAWFFRHRGLAIGLAIAGIGLGYAYVPLLLHYMIDNHGWRSGYYALSAVVVLVAMPLVYFFLRESPAELGLKPDGIDDGTTPKATRKDIGLTVRETLRHREFWLLVFIFIVLSFLLNGMLAHLVPMLSDRGMSPAAAASVAAVEGATVFFSRIFIGYLIDRIFAPYVAMFFFSLSAVGMTMFALGAVDGYAFLAAVLIGLSLGAEVDLLAYLATRYFGLRSFGSIYGLLFAAILAGTATGPIVFGLGYEATGSYVSVLVFCVGVNVLAVLLTALLGKYPDWEKAAG